MQVVNLCLYLYLGVSSIRTNPKDTELSDLLIQDEVEEGQSVLGGE